MNISQFFFYSSIIITNILFCQNAFKGEFTFASPRELFAQDYCFLNKYFYKIDPFYYEQKLENPLNLSTNFMVECLSELYKKRKYIICESINKPVDAILMASYSVGGIYERFVALQKSIKQFDWQFNKIHILVCDSDHAECCKKILSSIFDQSDILPINWIFTNSRSNMFVRGLKLLKLSGQLGKYYLIIEKSIHFSEKYILESRNILYDTSICLGANVIQSKEYLESVKTHNYDKIYPNYDDMICAWFHSEMNFFVRQLHYEYIYNQTITLKENFFSNKIKQKHLYHDLEKSFYFKKFCSVFLNKSLIAKKEIPKKFFALLRALGLLLYAKKNNPSKHYHLNRQLDIIKNAIVIDLNKNGLSNIMSHKYLNAIYKKELNILCQDSVEKFQKNGDDLNTLYQNIAEGREKLLIKIILDSINVIGPSPCKFAIMTFGSQARQEATPYSDIELGILVEKRTKKIDDYFFKLGITILYKLINLGKTPISYLRILSLSKIVNDANSNFIDYVIPAGLSCDALSGGKLPVSEQNEDSYYGTPQQLAIKVAKAKSNNNLYFMVTEKLLYGYEGLFLNYKAEKNKYNGVIKKQIFETLKIEISSFDKVYITNNNQIDIKKTFYRPFTGILEDFDTYLNLNAMNTNERIRKLYLGDYISIDEAEILELFLKKILLLRFIMHMKNKQRYGDYDSELQREVNLLLDEKDDVYKIFKRIPLNTYNS